MKILRPRFSPGQSVAAVCACLIAGFGFGFILEAIDPDLFPPGATDLGAAVPGWGGIELAHDAIRTPSLAPSVVLATGIHLIAAHRARSSLSGEGTPTCLTPLRRWPSRET
jgi:hypothetical protein